MKAPYFKGQEPNECGCYYPDVVLLEVNTTAKTKTLHCIVHGEYLLPLSDQYCDDDLKNEIPSDEWRQEERYKLWHSEIFSERSNK